MDEVFEERFVVFIDILGFGDMVSKAAENPNGEVARRVDTALTIISHLSLHDPDPLDGTQEIESFQSHIFSDCVIMSVIKETTAVSRLFVELAKLTVNLMAQGVWIRGGMSFGQISKRRSTPWGPAIVEAYRIESQLAVNPRIALSKSALEFVRQGMNGKEQDGLIVRDVDGMWALAPFTWALRDSYGKPAFLTQELGEAIKTRLEDAYDVAVDQPNVFRKVDWLMKQWDRQMKPKKSGEPKFDCRTQRGIELDKKYLYGRPS